MDNPSISALIGKLDELLESIIDDYGDSEIADGCSQAIAIIKDHTEGHVLVPIELIKIIGELWVEGMEPDDQISELTRLITNKGEPGDG